MAELQNNIAPIAQDVFASEEPKTVEQPAVEPRTVEQQSVEQPAVGPQAVEPKTVEQPAVGPQAVEQQPAQRATLGPEGQAGQSAGQVQPVRPAQPAQRAKPQAQPVRPAQPLQTAQQQTQPAQQRKQQQSTAAPVGLTIRYVLQALVLVCLLAFVCQFLVQPQDSAAPFDSVVAATTEGEDLSGLTAADNKDIKRYLGLDPSQFEQIAYYKNNDPMQATEFVVVKFADHSQAATFEAAIDARIASQKNIYDGYLPDEASRMAAAIVYTQANYGFYAVGDSGEVMFSRFKASLESGV